MKSETLSLKTIIRELDFLILFNKTLGKKRFVVVLIGKKLIGKISDAYNAKEHY